MAAAYVRGRPAGGAPVYDGASVHGCRLQVTESCCRTCSAAPACRRWRWPSPAPPPLIGPPPVPRVRTDRAGADRRNPAGRRGARRPRSTLPDLSCRRFPGSSAAGRASASAATRRSKASGSARRSTFCHERQAVPALRLPHLAPRRRRQPGPPARHRVGLLAPAARRPARGDPRPPDRLSPRSSSAPSPGPRSSSPPTSWCGPTSAKEYTGCTACTAWSGRPAVGVRHGRDRSAVAVHICLPS